MLDERSAAARDVQAHKLAVVFILAERFKNVAVILLDRVRDAVEILFPDVRRSRSYHLLDDRFVEYCTETVEHHSRSLDDALVHAELFREALAFDRLFVVDVHDIHRAVSDVCEHIHTCHF